MKILATILLLTGLTGMALADTPTQAPKEVNIDSKYFHPAASLYIHGDTTAASNLVARGRTIYPDDGKLKALEELIKKQQKKKQNQNKQNKKNQDQKKKDQKKKNNQQNNDQKNQNQNKQNQQQNNKQDQKKQNQNQKQDQQQKKNQQQNQKQQPQKAKQMSPAEAKQLLDAMKQQEKTQRMQLHPVMGAPIKVDKDW